MVIDEKATILVVDDVPMNIELMRLQLTRAGYDVLEAGDGMEALRMAVDHLPDLVLLDVMMPGMNGFEVCSRLKKDPRTQLIPIVLVTALHETEDRIKGIEAGADDFISKPFNRVELLTRVRSLLRIRKLYRDLEESLQEIENKNAILTEELKMARHVQQTLLPERIPTQESLDFVVTYLPTLEVGGDYYTYLPQGENKIGVFMSDVSGHGVSAAMITMIISTMVRSMAEEQKAPHELLKMVNQQLMRILDGNLQGTFVTAFYYIVDMEKNTITYANAGHPAPVLLNKCGEILLLTGEGFPLGMFPFSEYELHTKELLPGDKVILYTDGIYDVKNVQGDILGLPRFLEMVKNLSCASGQETLDAIIAEVNRFAGDRPKPDDICLIVMEKK